MMVVMPQDRVSVKFKYAFYQDMLVCCNSEKILLNIQLLYLLVSDLYKFLSEFRFHKFYYKLPNQSNLQQLDIFLGFQHGKYCNSRVELFLIVMLTKLSKLKLFTRTSLCITILS